MHQWLNKKKNLNLLSRNICVCTHLLNIRTKFFTMPLRHFFAVYVCLLYLLYHAGIYVAYPASQKERTKTTSKLFWYFIIKFRVSLLDGFTRDI